MSGQQATAVSVDHPEPLWTWKPDDGDESHDVRLGPVCESVCVAQAGSVLAALDPKTGRVLWQRFDIDADAGLFANERSGVFGDENLLVVFEADQKSYTLLETATPGRSCVRDSWPSDRTMSVGRDVSLAVVWSTRRGSTTDCGGVSGIRRRTGSNLICRRIRGCLPIIPTTGGWPASGRKGGWLSSTSPPVLCTLSSSSRRDRWHSSVR